MCHKLLQGNLKELRPPGDQVPPTCLEWSLEPPPAAGTGLEYASREASRREDCPQLCSLKCGAAATLVLPPSG